MGTATEFLLDPTNTVNFTGVRRICTGRETAVFVFNYHAKSESGSRNKGHDKGKTYFYPTKLHDLVVYIFWTPMRPLESVTIQYLPTDNTDNYKRSDRKVQVTSPRSSRSVMQ